VDPPKLGIVLPMHGIAPAQTLAVARAAERAGIDAVWVPDHLLNAGRPESGGLECWTILAAVAALTELVTLGTLVLAAAFRHTPLLAKQAATVEALAPGRFSLGLGAGGFTYEQTCRQFGIAPLAPRDRVAQLEETVRCLRTLWSDDPASFEGRFTQAREIRIHPRPERPIPIVLAARRRRMLELTARLADGWNCPLPHELEAGLAALERAGRPRDEIAIGVFAVAVLGASEAEARRALARAGPAAQMFGDVESHHVFGAPERAAARIAELARQGAQQITLDLRGLPPLEALECLTQQIRPLLP